LKTAHVLYRPLFGTNPMAFAAPRAHGAPLVIDQATSVVAKVALVEALRNLIGKTISLVTPDQCTAYIRHCGYNPQ
jgi:hypothetical protein